MLGWGVAAAVVLLVGVPAWRRSRGLRLMFSTDHLLELQRLLPGLKRAALQTSDETPPEGTPDPRTIQTSANLLVFYTVSRAGDRFAHHLSLSDRHGYTPMAVGLTFSVMLVKLLGLDVDQVSIARSNRAVFHTTFSLDEADHLAFTHRHLPLMNAEAIERLYLECLQIRSRVKLGSLSISDDDLRAQQAGAP